jgi:hypothetical protein
MLRSVVESFLGSVTEREFDSPLLAILASQGYYDIHFTHGTFEFGKDIIAKRADPETGVVHQYAIQAKAGDIGMSEWRSIRPQVEEAQENTLSHPNYDTNLPRTAVLATTGRLVGGAALDAQQLAQRAEERGGRFVIWDHEQFVPWLASEPALGLSANNSELLQVIAAIGQGVIREQELEFYSRNWLLNASRGQGTVTKRAAIEGAVIANKLRQAHRLDLAAYTALHLLRASWSVSPSVSDGDRPQLAKSAIALFGDYVGQLLNQALPKTSDPKALLRSIFDPNSMVTYPVVCCRLNELFALLALIEEREPDLLAATSGGTAAAAVVSLARHPGSSRPITDDFGSSLIAPVILLNALDEDSCSSFLAQTAKWIQDRYDAQADGLGLGSHGEPEEATTERLVGAALEATKLERRRTSYLATVVLDLAAVTGRADLYEAFRQNLGAYDIVPTITSANKAAQGARGGPNVNPNVSLGYRAWSEGAPLATHHSLSPRLPSIDELLVGSSTRSRHNYSAVNDLTTVSEYG